MLHVIFQAYVYMYLVEFLLSIFTGCKFFRIKWKGEYKALNSGVYQACIGLVCCVWGCWMFKDAQSYREDVANSARYGHTAGSISKDDR